MTEIHIKWQQNGILVSLTMDEWEFTGFVNLNFVIESIWHREVRERESDLKSGFYIIKTQQMFFSASSN